VLTELLWFIPLAVLSNTAFPLPFDHVLLWFAAGHSFLQAWVFAGFGSACAGVAALADVALLGAVGRRLSRRTDAGPIPGAEPRFYVAVVVVALLPIPYTMIRLALLRVRPRPLLYAVLVSIARLPRYLLLIGLWQALALPGWVGGLLVLSALGWIAWRPPRTVTAASRSLHGAVRCQAGRTHFNGSRQEATASARWDEDRS
jgi:hypothetical protein